MFIDQLKEACASNDFFITESTSQDPDVVLLKDVNFDHNSWLAASIESIIQACIEPGDSLFLSDLAGKVIVPGADIVGSGIDNFLRSQNNSIYGNDSYEAMRWHKAAMMWMHFAAKTGPGEQVIDAMKDIKEAISYRAESMIKGPFGLTKMKGRRFQVVAHEKLYSILPNYFAHEKLSYIAVGPINPPNKDSIKSYYEAVENLDGGTDDAKLNAIDIIAKTPVSNALPELLRASEWPRHSKRVRRYAGQVARSLAAREK